MLTLLEKGGFYGNELNATRRSRRIKWKDGTFLEAFLYKPSPDMDPGRIIAALGRELYIRLCKLWLREHVQRSMLG